MKVPLENLKGQKMFVSFTTSQSSTQLIEFSDINIVKSPWRGDFQEELRKQKCLSCLAKTYRITASKICCSLVWSVTFKKKKIVNPLSRAFWIKLNNKNYLGRQ